MPHKIKNVTKKIDEIKEEGRRDLGLQRGQREKTEGSINNEPFAPSIGQGIGTGMVGRETEKEKLMSLITSEANTDISVIPVVGLGGIGKTTLVQSVLDDKRVNVFDVKAFLHVSKQFNFQKIVTPILKRLNSTINLDNCDLSLLQDHLSKELVGRRYLIVLDDLWEENGDRLEELKQMLQHGRKGSRIVVTTRHQSVVQRLCTGHLANICKICPVPESDQINLDILSSEDCWGLMKLRAFGPYDDQSGLEAIGREIAEKCGGLPLVANALGQVMSESKNVEAWQNIRDTKVNLGLRDEDQKEALEKLMLSYYYMKRDFKMCFAYLAVFPNGFVMNSNHLIQQWHALGYINSRHDGQRCINYLLGMSFLKIDQNTPLVSIQTPFLLYEWFIFTNTCMFSLFL
jgi:GTPase SAR1 family protein